MCLSMLYAVTIGSKDLAFDFSHSFGLFAIFLLSHTTYYTPDFFSLKLPTISCQQIIKSGNQVSSHPGITGV